MSELPEHPVSVLKPFKLIAIQSFESNMLQFRIKFSIKTETLRYLTSVGTYSTEVSKK